MTYEPAPLLADVVREYESITGDDVNTEAFVVAERVATVLRHIRHGRSDELVAAVRDWR